jgi:hypothetical protein
MNKRELTQFVAKATKLSETHTTFSLKTGKGWRKLGACVRL